MENTHPINRDLNRPDHVQNEYLEQSTQDRISFLGIFKKIRGGFFLVLGYLLSPLSWWNDLFFNLPIAYGFGYLCSLFSKDLLIPCAIAGYWLSNVLGILLMQAGVVDIVHNQPQERNFKKELLTGLASSTAYTLIILALMHFKILEAPSLFPGG
jgi:hypothetical protein